MTCYEYQTPGTRLWWGSLPSWCASAHQICKRRASAQRTAALKAHVGALPERLIVSEDDPAVIEAALELLKHGPQGLARPRRGLRSEAPHTPRIMWLENRAAVLRRQADVIPLGGNWRAVHER